MLCALAVAFLWLSGVIPLSTYAWPILASATLCLLYTSHKRAVGLIGAVGKDLVCDAQAQLLACINHLAVGKAKQEDVYKRQPL